MSLVEYYKRLAEEGDEKFRNLRELTKTENFPENAKKQAEQYVREGIAKLTESL